MKFNYITKFIFTILFILQTMQNLLAIELPDEAFSEMPTKVVIPEYDGEDDNYLSSLVNDKGVKKNRPWYWYNHQKLDIYGINIEEAWKYILQVLGISTLVGLIDNFKKIQI